MWVEERQSRILSLLKDKKRVEADKLAQGFNVSRETIRRDLKVLEEKGLLLRTHGGALINEPSQETPFSVRRVSRVSEKRALAKSAVTLMSGGGSYFVDAGSTTAAMGEFLSRLGGVSIVTNSIDLALSARANNSEADIVLLGGTLASDVPATFGEITLRQLRTFHADIAFVSPVGIDPKVGISYYDLAEADLAGLMLEQARMRVVIADSSKCGVTSRVIVSECDRIDTLITNHGDTSEYQRAGIREILHAAT